VAKLAEYRKKRDPKKTPEPFAGKKGAKEPIFVIQRHDARRLHYDFRLEREGALASWAVPKGIPLEPGERHLAVHVEDHPIDYATFEGEIPKGQYGAGTVEIFDSGTYELVEEKRDGGLTVRLHGKKLEGLWTLVPAKLDGDPKNWLLIRKREDGETRHLPETAPAERGAQPGRGLHGPEQPEVLRLQLLDTDDLVSVSDRETEGPVVRRPRAESAPVLLSQRHAARDVLREPEGPRRRRVHLEVGGKQVSEDVEVGLLDGSKAHLAQAHDQTGEGPVRRRLDRHRRSVTSPGRGGAWSAPRPRW